MIYNRPTGAINESIGERIVRIGLPSLSAHPRKRGSVVSDRRRDAGRFQQRRRHIIGRADLLTRRVAETIIGARRRRRLVPVRVVRRYSVLET